MEERERELQLEWVKWFETLEPGKRGRERERERWLDDEREGRKKNVNIGSR